ncbi:Cyanovirin-N [Naviculisporaceae sp. PSN 640]
MHFFSSPLGTAILMALATKTFALPSAPAVSVVPEPVPAGAEPQLAPGTVVPESEAALLLADPASELVFSPVLVDDNGHITFSEGSETFESPSLVDKRSYVGSCNSCTIVNNVALRCNCRNEGGGWIWSDLDLNKCLANANGQLDWRLNGGFGGSCRGYLLSGGQHFQTQCTTYPGGPYNWTWSKNLDERIHNWNGILVCTP